MTRFPCRLYSSLFCYKSFADIAFSVDKVTYLVSIIVRVNSHSTIAQHGFNAGGRNHQFTDVFSINDRICKLMQYTKLNTIWQNYVRSKVMDRSIISVFVLPFRSTREHLERSLSNFLILDLCFE